MGQTSWPAPDADPDLDRAVSDVQFEQLSQMYAANGLYGSPTDQPLVYGDGTGLAVKLRPNRLALVQGHPWRSDGAGLVVPIGAVSAARVDLIVLRLNRATWKVTAEVRAGVAGGSAPSPQQDLDVTGAGTGLWELPIAEVTLPAGATTVIAGQVKPVAWYLAPPTLAATETTMPPVRANQLLMQPDTGRLLMASGSAWHIVGENGPLTKLSPSPGWDATQSTIYVRRRNGHCLFQSLTYKTSPSSSLPSGTDVNVTVLPDKYRPLTSFYTSGFKGESLARFYISASTGAVTMVAYPGSLDAGQFVIVNACKWDANNLT